MWQVSYLFVICLFLQVPFLQVPFFQVLLQARPSSTIATVVHLDGTLHLIPPQCQWPSHLMVSRSCLDLGIGQYGSGMRPQEHHYRCLRATLTGSHQWPSHLMVSRSHLDLMIRWYGSGTWPWEHHYRCLRATLAC